MDLSQYEVREADEKIEELNDRVNQQEDMHLIARIATGREDQNAQSICNHSKEANRRQYICHNYTFIYCKD